MPPEQQGPGSQEQTSEASRDLKKSKEEKENPNNKENEDEVPLPIQRARSSPSLRKGLVDQVPMLVQRARSPATLRKGLVLQPCEGDGQNDDVRKNVIFQEATVHLQINSAANDTDTVMSSHQQQHTNEYLKRSLQKSPREPIPPPIGPENLRNLESPVLPDNGGDVNDQPSSSLKIVRSLRRTDSQVTSERKPLSNFKQGIHPRNVSTSSISGLANPFDVTRPRPRKTKNSLAATTRAEAAAAASTQEKNSSLTTTSASLEEQPGGDVKEVQQVQSGTESPKPAQHNEVVSGTSTGLKDDQSLLSQNTPPEQQGPGPQEQTSEASRDSKKSKEEKENPNNKENEDQAPLPVQRARSPPTLRKGLVDQVPLPVQRARSPPTLRKGLVDQVPMPVQRARSPPALRKGLVSRMTALFSGNNARSKKQKDNSTQPLNNPMRRAQNPPSRRESEVNGSFLESEGGKLEASALARSASDSELEKSGSLLEERLLPENTTLTTTAESWGTECESIVSDRTRNSVRERALSPVSRVAETNPNYDVPVEQSYLATEVVSEDRLCTETALVESPPLMPSTPPKRPKQVGNNRSWGGDSRSDPFGGVLELILCAPMSADFLATIVDDVRSVPSSPTVSERLSVGCEIILGSDSVDNQSSISSKAGVSDVILRDVYASGPVVDETYENALSRIKVMMMKMTTNYM